MFVWIGHVERDDLMPRVSAKRQITLPIDQCREVGIGPGDEYRSFVADGRITIVRKTAGAARGYLRHITGDPAVGDEESLQDALNDENDGADRRRCTGGRIEPRQDVRR